ncbi:serine/threonine-protein phosphatase rdgC isoform X1 [Zootermopsis nevadensis]|uniref:serine/threonine-protein phosphatase rdgC isoform X1 n=1 Tax=Zootermopsis nevadensis TaxID=136037 RepID=UPI000B8EB542|nr:serine/threonine-protein phosphatase rdgC isoform X1 [Zootermopsis nevadensis]XP_021924334.1 serine/threonine-protein phosphatase rdgC isoform X1 [Zootermopsis nevadensis]
MEDNEKRKRLVYHERDGEVTVVEKTRKGFFSKFSPRNLFRSCKGGKKTEFSMPKVERTMKAAILIQRWYRRYLARMEVRRRYTWTIFQSIEYAGEQDQLKLYNFFNALLTHMPDATAKKPGSEISSKSSSIDTVDQKYEDESEDGSLQSADGGYKGIHISFPLTRADLDALIDTFRKKRQPCLHAKYVAGILKEAIVQLKRLPNLNQASTAISKQITICGDLHGKFDDLLVIFHKNGLPSTENPYVFNGDFVDRGKKGLEVLLLLLSCLLVFPGGVFLNRGNHEDHIMNARYGFIREVKSKYKHNAERLLRLIERVYRWLPLGTVVNNKVLVVHGGISDVTDLDWVRNLDRHKYVSLLRPPITESSAPGAELIDKLEWKQVFDILWSDPQPGDGCFPNSLRGAGTYFGPDVTEKFLQKYKLLYLIRSHECKPGGYELTHSSKVITIFSASNYYEVGSNKGAYVKLVGPQLAPHFVQFTAATPQTKKLTFRQRVGLVESSAIRELSCQILARREQLLEEFLKHDPEKTGLISLSEWCAAMEDQTRLGIPWRMLREKLVTLDPSTGKVEYHSTFQEHTNGRRSSGTTVVETLYRNKSSLEAIFRIIDKDNSGYISMEEFSDACSLLGEHLPQIPPEQLVDICRSMDINKDGLVDLNEFLETFRLVDMEHEDRTEGDDSSPDEDTHRLE